MNDSLLVLGAVDDHPVLLRGVLAGLAECLPGHQAVIAPTIHGLLESGHGFDVVLLDVDLNDGSDPAANVKLLVARGWPVLLFTQAARPSQVAACLRAGAVGVVTKNEDVDVVAAAIGQILRGEPVLSVHWARAVQADPARPELAPREAEALKLYAAGLPMKSVANRMDIAIDTAKEYLGRVKSKYAGVGRPAYTKTDLYVRAVEDGHLEPPAAR